MTHTMCILSCNPELPLSIPIYAYHFNNRLCWVQGNCNNSVTRDILRWIWCWIHSALQKVRLLWQGCKYPNQIEMCWIMYHLHVDMTHVISFPTYQFDGDDIHHPLFHLGNIDHYQLWEVLSVIIWYHRLWLELHMAWCWIKWSLKGIRAGNHG